MRSSSRAEPWLRNPFASFVYWSFASLLCAGWPARSVLAQTTDESSALRVVLSAPADGDCIDEAELRARVAERLGRRTVSASEGSEFVHVQLQRAEGGSGWKALLSAQSSAAHEAPRTRQIDSASPSCRALDDGLVLVLAALVGVARPGEVSETEAVREPPPEPPPEPAREPALTPEPHPSAESDAFNGERLLRARAARPVAHPFVWSFAAAGALASGKLPGLAWGASTALQGEWRRLGLILGALALPSVSKDLGQGAHAQFASVAALLRVCGSVVRERWLQAALCVGATGGAVHTRTRGLAFNTASWRPSSDGELSLRLSGLVAWRVRWLLQVAGTLPFTRMRFVFDESGGERRVYHRAGAGVLLELGAIFGGAS